MTDDTFTLRNDPPPPPRGDFPGREPTRQGVLFTGLNLPPNTRNLFDTDYAPSVVDSSDDEA